MVFPRTLAVLVAASALIASCGHNPARHPAASPSKRVAAPAPPVCADPTAALSTRDKLAQLLMVGVRNGDEARTAVNNSHVGGIIIGGWTDLSIFQGPLADVAG